MYDKNCLKAMKVVFPRIIKLKVRNFACVFTPRLCVCVCSFGLRDM